MQIKQNEGQKEQEESLNTQNNKLQTQMNSRNQDAQQKQNIQPPQQIHIQRQQGDEDLQSPQYLPKNKKTVIKWLYTHFNTKNKLKALKKNPLFGQVNQDPSQESSCNEDNNSQRKSFREPVFQQNEGSVKDGNENYQQKMEEKQDKSNKNEANQQQEKQYTPFEIHEKSDIQDKYVMFSLNFFERGSIIRLLCLRFIQSKIYQIIEFAFTVLNVAALMMADYTFRTNHDNYLNYNQNLVKYYLEIISNFILTLLSFTKIISYGLIIGPNTFLRKKWNIFDSMVLTSSWISLSSNQYEPINILKMFRTVFFIRINKTLQHQMNSFISGFKELWKPFVPFFSVVLIYSVIGLYFFNGLLESRCRLTSEPLENPYRWPVVETETYPCGYKSCPDNTYCSNPSDYDLPSISSDKNNLIMFFGFANFDSIFQSIYTVQSFFTINGWISVQEMFWRSQNKSISGIYFGSLVLFLAHLFGNMVLATLHESFMEHHSICGQHQEQSKNSKGFNLKKLLQDEMKMQEQQLQSQITQIDNLKRRKSFFNKILNVTIKNIVQENEMKQLPPNSFFCQIIRLYLKKASRSLTYKSIRFINIIIQAIILCLDRQRISDEELRALNMIDFISTIILFIEIPFEIISNGWNKYWKENLNRLDFFIGLSHLIMYSIEQNYGRDLFIVTSQYSIFFRSTKILRLYRLFYSFTLFESVKVILKTYAKTIKMIPGYFMLMSILIILYAIIGRELFSEKVSLQVMRINFNSLADSLIAVILFCFNEEWHIIMYEYYHYAGYKSIIFCLLCVYTCQVIMVRLFIAIFIHNFMNWLRFFENQFQASSPFINHMSNVIKKFIRKIVHYLKRRQQKKKQEKIRRIQQLIESKKQIDKIFEQTPNFLSPTNYIHNTKNETSFNRFDSLKIPPKDIRSRAISRLEGEENTNMNGQILQKRSTLPTLINKPDKFIQDTYFGVQQSANASKFKANKKNQFLEDAFSPQSEPSDAMLFGNGNLNRDSFNSNVGNTMNNSLIKFQKFLQQQQKMYYQNTLLTTPQNNETVNFTENVTNGFNLISPKERNQLQVPDNSQKDESSCQSSVVNQNNSEAVEGDIKEISASFLKETEQVRKYYSFFIFSPLNPIRQKCKYIAELKLFKQIKPMLLFIFAIIQALQEPYLDPNSEFGKTLYGIDISLMIIFNIQTIIYSIAYGAVLFLGEKEVTLNFNNFFEIVFNITHFLFFLPVSNRDIYVLRVFKIFRLLLLINFLSEKYTSINFAGRVWIACIPRMFKILIFGTIFMFINSVFVTKLMKGQMTHCQYNQKEVQGVTIDTKSDCMDIGGDWLDKLYRFDDILSTMSVLFMIQSSEGWMVIMIQQFDATSENFEPKLQHYSPWILFYIQFFFIANFCILNMFVGVVVDTFRELKESETQIDKLTPYQKEWYYIKHSIYNLQITKQVNPPNNYVGRIIYNNLFQRKYLQYIFNAVTIINCVAILGYTHRQHEKVAQALNQINLVCMISFSIEIICKMISLRTFFFKNSWNWFSVVTLIIALINIHFQMDITIKSYDHFYRIFGGIAKGLQLIRVYRILIQLNIMKKLLNSFFGAVSNIFGLSTLVILFLYISVLIAMNLFPYIKNQQTIDDYDTNFKNFLMSLFTLIRVATSEYWFPIVAECSTQQSPAFICRNDIYTYEDYIKYGKNSCGSNVSHYFFFLFFLVFTLFILNLLIASIILAYKEAYIQEESALNLYQLEDIRKLWSKFDPEGIGFINYKLFWQFSGQIALIFGIQSEDLLDISLKKKFLQTLDIPMFEDPINKTLVYKFHDVIVSLAEISLKIKYQIQNLEPENKEIKKFHKKTLKKQQTTEESGEFQKSMFRSTDMVVIMTIIRKIKEWKKRYLEKDQDYQVFDLKNLTKKLISFNQQQSNIQSVQSSQQLSINNDIPSEKDSVKTPIKQVENKNISLLKPSEFQSQFRKSVQFDNRLSEKEKCVSEASTPQRKSAMSQINYSILITSHVENQVSKQEKQEYVSKLEQADKKDSKESPSSENAQDNPAAEQAISLKIGNFVQQTQTSPSKFKAEQQKQEQQKKDSITSEKKRRKKSKRASRSLNFDPSALQIDIKDSQLNYSEESAVANQIDQANFIFVYDEKLDFYQNNNQKKGSIQYQQSSQSSFSEQSSTSQKSSCQQSRKGLSIGKKSFS